MESQNVRIGSLETSNCPILAEPVFENARGLFDGLTVLITFGVENRVNLSLSDYDVLLTTHPAV